MALAPRHGRRGGRRLFGDFGLVAFHGLGLPVVPRRQVPGAGRPRLAQQFLDPQILPQDRQHGLRVADRREDPRQPARREQVEFQEDGRELAPRLAVVGRRGEAAVLPEDEPRLVELPPPDPLNPRLHGRPPAGAGEPPPQQVLGPGVEEHPPVPCEHLRRRRRGQPVLVRPGQERHARAVRPVRQVVRQRQVLPVADLDQSFAADGVRLRVRHPGHPPGVAAVVRHHPLEQPRRRQHGRRVGVPQRRLERGQGETRIARGADHRMNPKIPPLPRAVPRPRFVSALRGILPR